VKRKKHEQESTSRPVVWLSDALFKIVTKESNDPDGPDVLAFIYPQVAAGYGDADSYRHERFLTTVDEIEELTKLDFLTALPRSVQAEIESQRATELWPADAADFVPACRR
jgi:endonuclease G